VCNDVTPAIPSHVPVAEAEPPLTPRAIKFTFKVTDNMIIHGPDGLIAKVKVLVVAYLLSGGVGDYLLKKTVMLNITNHVNALHNKKAPILTIISDSRLPSKLLISSAKCGQSLS
jgi:hypothetical protein